MFLYTIVVILTIFPIRLLWAAIVRKEATNKSCFLWAVKPFNLPAHYREVRVFLTAEAVKIVQWQKRSSAEGNALKEQAKAKNELETLKINAITADVAIDIAKTREDIAKKLKTAAEKNRDAMSIMAKVSDIKKETDRTYRQIEEARGNLRNNNIIPMHGDYSPNPLRMSKKDGIDSVHHNPLLLVSSN